MKNLDFYSQNYLQCHIKFYFDFWFFDGNNYVSSNLVS